MALSETFPERVARIREEQNVSVMTARRVAAAESRIERAVRDKKTARLAEDMRQKATA